MTTSPDQLAETPERVGAAGKREAKDPGQVVMSAMGRKQTCANGRNGWIADLTGLCPLNFYKGDHAYPNYVLSGIIFDNDELIDLACAAFQVVGCKLSGCPHGKLLHSLQVGKRRAFLIEDALAIDLNVEEVGLHLT